MTYFIHRGFDNKPIGSAVTREDAETAIRKIAKDAGVAIIELEVDEVEDGVDALLANGVILSTRKPAR